MKKIYLLSNMFSFRPHSLKENSDLTGLFMHYKAQYEKLVKKLSRVGLLITDFFRAKLTCQEHHKFFQWKTTDAWILGPGKGGGYYCKKGLQLQPLQHRGKFSIMTSSNKAFLIFGDVFFFLRKDYLRIIYEYLSDDVFCHETMI